MIKCKIFARDCDKLSRLEDEITIWFDVECVSEKDIINISQTVSDNFIIYTILYFTENTD